MRGWYIVTVLLWSAVATTIEGKAVPSVPDFGKAYHVKGQVSTYQIGVELPWGSAYKITPETTEVELNIMKCFQVNGTKEEPVTPQGSLPDLQGFTMEYYGGALCEVWQNVTAVGHKKNTYTLWVTRPEGGVMGGAELATPLHYEMMGYNTLLGSHYDKYLVDYKEFSSKFDPKVFALPDGMSCGSFPGPGVEHHLLANPMKDLIHTSSLGHAQRLFGHFKEQFGRRYGDEREHEKREHAFVHNLRYVHSMNRAGLSFSLAVNSLSDRSMSELSAMRGRNRGKRPNNGLQFPMHLYTGVQDQAICGSCWSFATTGAIEGALFLKSGSLQVLSQQMLVDCSWGFGNNGCDGGEEWRAYEWIMKHGGIATTETYGSYMGMNGLCHFNSSQLTARVQSYTNVTSGDAEALKVALFKNGPVAIRNTTDSLDHAVLAVGYGVMEAEPYWLVKNSWSTYWGNDGYILMSMKDNNCGVTTDATYVTLA
ncbi:unnamed protein product [Coregonus sp. 'balchen']|nr:unnamed protein product [Coregonus sp. 'balchen']